MIRTILVLMTFLITSGLVTTGAQAQEAASVNPYTQLVEKLPETYSEHVYYTMARDWLNDDTLFGTPDLALIHARIAKMIRMGYLTQAQGLFDILDVNMMEDEQAAKTGLTLKFLHRKTAEACLDIQAMQQNFDQTLWWSDLKLFCDMHYSDGNNAEKTNDTTTDSGFILYVGANQFMGPALSLSDIRAFSPMEIGLLFASKHYDAESLSKALNQSSTSGIPGLIVYTASQIEGLECLHYEAIYRGMTRHSDFEPDSLPQDCAPAWAGALSEESQWNHAIDHILMHGKPALPTLTTPEESESAEAEPEGETSIEQPAVLTESASGRFIPLQPYLNNTPITAESYMQWHADHFASVFRNQQKDPAFLVNILKHKQNSGISQQEQIQLYEKLLTLTFYEKHVIPSIGLTEYLSLPIEEKQKKKTSSMFRVLADFGSVKAAMLDPQTLSKLLETLQGLGLTQAADRVGLTALRL